MSVAVISFRGSPLQQASVFWWHLGCSSRALNPAPATPIASTTTHQVPPLLCLGGHLWKPQWGWRIVSGMVLGNEMYKVSVVRQNVLVFLILCGWAAQIQSRPLQMTPPHALSLGSVPFPTVSLNAHQPEIFLKYEKYKIFSPPQETVTRTKTSDCPECAGLVFPVYCLGSCLLLLPLAWVLCSVLSHSLLSPPWWNREQDQILARDISGYRCHFPHPCLYCQSASHSNRVLFYPYGLCPLWERWQWFKIILWLSIKAEFHMTVSFGETYHNHLIFFSMKMKITVWNYSIPQDWEKSVFALVINTDPCRMGDKGTQLRAQVFSCSILSARQAFLQPNVLKGILHRSKRLKK